MSKSAERNKGFTLAELLVVVAIIGILVAVSVPMFAAQKKKAVRAVNQANIRAAKAAAMTELYAGANDYTDYLEYADTGDGLGKYIYFVYDVKQSKIVETIIPKKNQQGEINWETANTPGRKLLNAAANDQVCDKIYVFINIHKNKNYNAIQTAPYYDKDGKVGTVEGTNPFGPR